MMQVGSYSRLREPAYPVLQERLEGKAGYWVAEAGERGVLVKEEKRRVSEGSASPFSGWGDSHDTRPAHESCMSMRKTFFPPGHHQSPSPSV